jgi:hypothetical protein
MKYPASTEPTMLTDATVSIEIQKRSMRSRVMGVVILVFMQSLEQQGDIA